MDDCTPNLWPPFVEECLMYGEVELNCYSVCLTACLQKIVTNVLFVFMAVEQNTRFLDPRTMREVVIDLFHMGADDNHHAGST